MLEKYSLNTVAECQDKIPIVLQSFYEEALKTYAETGSDLPQVLLLQYSEKKKDQFPDWDLFSELYNGIGAKAHWIMNPDALTFG